jgi:hypothetical protein
MEILIVDDETGIAGFLARGLEAEGYGVPVATGSTGYRFARYYSGNPPYVRKGPPHLSCGCSPPSPAR